MSPANEKWKLGMQLTLMISILPFKIKMSDQSIQKNEHPQLWEKAIAGKILGKFYPHD